MLYCARGGISLYLFMSERASERVSGFHISALRFFFSFLYLLTYKTWCLGKGGKEKKREQN